MGAGEGQREFGGAPQQGGLVISAGVRWGNATISVHSPDKKTAEMIHPALLPKPARSGESPQACLRGHDPATQRGTSPSAKESERYGGEACQLARHGVIVNDGGVLQD